MTTWYSVVDADEQTRLVRAWPDAPVENEEVCGLLLGVARDQVLAWAPALAPVPDGEPVPDPPDRYVYGQLQQARNLWDAGRVDTDGNVGDGQFVFIPRPLDKTVKDILRPKDGGLHVL